MKLFQGLLMILWIFVVLFLLGILGIRWFDRDMDML